MRYRVKHGVAASIASYLDDLDKLVFTEIIDWLVLDILECIAAVSFVYLLNTYKHVYTNHRHTHTHLTALCPGLPR